MVWLVRAGGCESRFLVAAVALFAALGCGSDSGSESTAGGGGSGGTGGQTSGGSAGDSPRGGSAGSSVGGNGGTGGGSQPGVDEFCERFVDEFAGYMERCSCDASSVANYRMLAASFCETDGFLGSLPAAVLAGDFTYDADAAERLFDRLHEPNPSCLAETFLALELDSVELYSLAGTFVGTGALGDACRHPVGYKGGISDCREGVCAPDDAGGGVCIAFVGLGEECDAGGNANFDSTSARFCHEVRMGDQDGEYETSFDRLACLPSASNSSVRTCQHDLADGTACRTSYVCTSGYCEYPSIAAELGVCSPKRANGEPCESSGACASGACQNAAPRVCGALLVDGEPCVYSNEACASGRCNDLVDPVVCGPRAGRAVGDTCTMSSECISDSPAGPFAGSCHDGRCIHDICEAFLE